MKFITGVLFGLFLSGAVVAIVLATGSYDVAATKPPSKWETKIATFALNRSVSKRAPRGGNPMPATPEVLKAGLDHYRENCVTCHGAPGVDASEIGEGLNPPAPDLTLPRVQSRPPAEMFWIVSNGIRSTGMPAFGPTHDSNEIWKIVTFLKHLPEVGTEEQKILKAGTEEADHHHEEKSAPAAETMPSPPATPHDHPPGTPPHKH
ncbi:MAG: cytochrome c [Acidobacteriota bacterium]